MKNKILTNSKNGGGGIPNNNAFTLIELLAIIIILAIIAVITIPIILNAIENSKRGAAIDSAYGYNRAVNQYYLTKMAFDPTFDIDDGVYIVNDDGTLFKEPNKLDIDVTGQAPTKGWVEIEKGEVKYFSIKIGDYIVSLTGESDEVVATKGDEPLLTEEQRKIVELQKKAEDYLNELKQQCNDNIKNKAKDVSYLNDLVSESEKPTKGWVKFDENCNATDFSVKYGDSVVSYDEVGENGYKSIVTEGEPKTKPIQAPVSFEEDDWDTIIDNVKEGNTSKYTVGAKKTVEMDVDGDSNKETYTLRIANNSNYDCTLASKTACGFVLEFETIITDHQMNPYTEGVTTNGNGNIGGWKDSNMRKYLNCSTGETVEGLDCDGMTETTIYDLLPSEIKNAIIPTTVVSGHGSTQGEENFTTTDKLYLLSRREVWNNTSKFDTAQSQTRQLDYYANNGVTTSANLTFAKKIKLGSTSTSSWWLRSAPSDYSTHFNIVDGIGGNYNSQYSSNKNGVAPAFRIG